VTGVETLLEQARRLQAGGEAADASAIPGPANPADRLRRRMVDGAAFILDVPAQPPPLWGDGDEVLWAQGEPFLLCGPPGVGKTTLAGQVLRARLGLDDAVLGWGVETGAKKTLYLAMDRPPQIARSLRRVFRPEDRDLLRERLVVWRGPPPGDLAQTPMILTEMCQAAGADTVFLDSLKDAAVGLTDDVVGSGLNRAIQQTLVDGCEVLGTHHQTKRGANGSAPDQLADVYGSAWITAGAGSVVLLWGNAGDPVVGFRHLKQPLAEVGPMQLKHDHVAGRTTVFHEADLFELLRVNPRGLTAQAAATVIFGVDSPTPAQVEKARRRLDRYVSDGLAHPIHTHKEPTRYYRVVSDS
jgi:hypothetical protein